MSNPKVPSTWEKWCKSGAHGRGARKKNAVLRCLSSGQVRGYFSDLVLRPDLPDTDSMYPSLEHLVDPKNHAEAVVEARIFNDMKSHLSEVEFWQVIEHLFAVGIEKKKIVPPFGKKLPKRWSPTRHYISKKTPNKAPEPTPTSVTLRATSGGTELKRQSVSPNPARSVPAAVVAHL